MRPPWRQILVALAFVLVPLAAAWGLTRPTGHDTDAFDAAFLLVAGFASPLAATLAWVLARRATQPVEQVAAAADRIARGARGVQLEARAGGPSGRLVGAFNHMAREIDVAASRLRRAERLAAWRDIARQMAHEIKNPLTPIQMAVEMLRKARARGLPDFDTLFDEETRIVLEEVARLRRLVEDFSRFARAPRPRLESGVSVPDLLAHVVALQAAASRAEVTGEAEPGLPLVRADREQLTQVLINLVANAAQAATERSPGATAMPAVHVSARDLRDGRIAIAIDDNGPGVDPVVLERLFEPYVTTRQDRGGTGLGLAVAYRIVQEHGGGISTETSPEGTRFEVTLPIAGPALTDATLDTEDGRRAHGLVTGARSDRPG